MSDKDDTKKTEEPKPVFKADPEPPPGPMEVPKCGRCKKPFTQCQCTHNDLQK